ncbi:TonB-dependent receptor [Parerythrobacter aurantius]|uniref:TonB-dependent receptor domain-containing protein n=1 Tax=Parerythrobacter aurantius TaxID=3127706 RepID=UPI003256777F
MSIGKQLAGWLLITTALTTPGAVFAQDQGQPEEEAVADEIATGEDLTTQEPAGEPPLEDPAADPATDEGPDVSIPGGGNIITVTGRRGPRDITRSSTQVVSVLSTEDIARTGDGDIASAISRVTGLSDNGDGRVFVRGLGDRYSLALLNGLPLPSPNPLSRVVPLDIFPTDIVASSLVQKTYSANFPGEFGGGVINLTTTAVPDEGFLKIGFGVSGDTITTFGDSVQYYGSSYDKFGFTTERRDAPPALQAYFNGNTQLSDLPLADQQAIATQLNVPNLLLVQEVSQTQPNFSGGITLGDAYDIGTARLGIIATANLSNSFTTRNVISQTPDDLDLNLRTDFRDFVTNNRITANALIGLGLEIDEHRFRWTNVYIRDTLKQAVISRGQNLQDGDDELQQSTGWFERQLIDSQLIAELEFGDLEIDLRGGYAQTDRESPFEYEFEYVRTNNAGDETGDIFVNPLNRIRGDLAQVSFSDLTEKLWYGGADVSYPVIPDLVTLTVGGAYSDTSRISSFRQFLWDSDSDFPSGVGALRPDLLLGDAIIEFYDVGLFETSQVFPVFAADLEIKAGYVKADIAPFDGLTIDIGVRYEDAVQTVSPVQIFSNQQNLDAVTSLANDYFLPGATITWEVADGFQLRASGSKTIARPQFRELIFQPYTDPESNRTFVGNPALQDSTLTNAELRGEYYFGSGSRFAVAGFWKKIDNPIEPFSGFTDNDQTTQFANAPEATLWGGEVELQWNYDLIDLGGWFESKRAVVVANYTYTQSELKVGDDDETLIFTPGVGSVPRPASSFFFDGFPLTGQSDHIANLQIGIEDLDKLQQATFIMSYASERVTSRGAGGLPDILENPGFRLDFVVREGITIADVPLELKLEMRNLTGRDNFEYLATGTNRIEVNSFDVGRSFSFSVSAEF